MYNSTCMICLNMFKSRDDLYHLECLHIYHKDCLEKMLMHDIMANCSVCRNDINNMKNIVYTDMIKKF